MNAKIEIKISRNIIKAIRDQGIYTDQAYIEVFNGMKNEEINRSGRSTVTGRPIEYDITDPRMVMIPPKDEILGSAFIDPKKGKGAAAYQVDVPVGATQLRITYNTFGIADGIRIEQENGLKWVAPNGSGSNKAVATNGSVTTDIFGLQNSEKLSIIVQNNLPPNEQGTTAWEIRLEFSRPPQAGTKAKESGKKAWKQIQNVEQK